MLRGQKKFPQKLTFLGTCRRGRVRMRPLIRFVLRCVARLKRSGRMRAKGKKSRYLARLERHLFLERRKEAL